jgi:hypothetical protein
MDFGKVHSYSVGHGVVEPDYLVHAIDRESHSFVY